VLHPPHIIYVVRHDQFNTLETPKIGPMTLKFELGQGFCTMHLPTKSDHPLLNNLQLSCCQANKQTKRSDGESIFHIFHI